MVEASQDLPLHLETAHHRFAIHPFFDDLERDLPLEAAVRPFGQVDVAHAATADLAQRRDG